MDAIRVFIGFGLLASVAACREPSGGTAAVGSTDLGRPSIAAPEDAESGEMMENGRLVFRYDTKDRDDWPVYDLPLEHTFDVPPVPEQIRGPFSPEILPDSQ